MEKSIQIYNDIIQYFKANYINLAFILVFIVVGFIISNFLQHRVKLRLANKSPNHITANFTSQIVGFVLKSIVVFATLYLLGLSSFTNKLLAGAGLLTFVIGFALKDIGENFLAGIILAFKSPFRMDDLIEVNGITGHVKDISIRETMVKTPDGKDVFLPNAILLKNPLFNYTLDGYLRYEFTVGIAYENNPTEAIKLILDTINNVEGVLKGDKKPNISIHELATNTLNINIKFWIDTFESTRRTVHNSIRSQAMNDVVAALIANGFSLPASIVELKNYDSSGDLHLKLETNNINTQKMKNYRETLSQVMNRLKEEGYNGNIPSDEIKLLDSSEWKIDDIHRFEGNSNPADNSILYAISRKDGKQKMMLINAYGVDSEKEVSNFIKQLNPS